MQLPLSRKTFKKMKKNSQATFFLFNYMKVNRNTNHDRRSILLTEKRKCYFVIKHGHIPVGTRRRFNLMGP